MAVFEIISKTFGTHKVQVDEADLKRLKELGGKWCLSKKRGRYYVQKRINNHIIELQRYLLNPKKGEYVDHINHDTLDNRRVNLRICNNAANLRNGQIRSNNSSGVNGIHWDKSRNKWAVRIKVNYKQIHLGRFHTLEEATKVRKLAELKYWN